jgi:hypothetical protein
MRFDRLSDLQGTPGASAATATLSGWNAGGSDMIEVRPAHDFDGMAVTAADTDSVSGGIARIVMRLALA